MHLNYWRGRYFKAGEETGDGRISAEIALLFLTAARMGFTSEEWAALDSLLKQAMQAPELQTALAELELEYGEV